jgi:hypothetical protein
MWQAQRWFRSFMGSLQGNPLLSNITVSTTFVRRDNCFRNPKTFPVPATSWLVTIRLASGAALSPIELNRFVSGFSLLLGAFSCDMLK